MTPRRRLLRPAGLAGLAALGLFALTALSAAPAKVCPRCHQLDCEYTVGINLAGAEFGSAIPGVEGRDYGWPVPESLDYWKGKGIHLVRLPFLWERLQPELMNDFDPTYAAGLQRSVKLLRDRGMVAILDVHNYAKYRKQPIGSASVPVAAFADLWRRLAAAFKGDAGIYGYGLMNEPTRQCDWPKAAQAAIDAIRTVDKQTRIYVANDYAGWSATRAKGDLAEWAEKGLPIPDPAALKDPSNRLRWELHAYFDHDASGTYKKSYAEEIARKDGPEVRVGPDTGVTRIAPFVAWLKKHKVKGLIGEHSAPANPGVDERWLVTLDKTLAFLDENCVPSTYWAAGTRWSVGPGSVIERVGWARTLSAEERAADRPQWKVLMKYLR